MTNSGYMAGLNQINPALVAMMLLHALTGVNICFYLKPVLYLCKTFLAQASCDQNS